MPPAELLTMDDSAHTTAPTSARRASADRVRPPDDDDLEPLPYPGLRALVWSDIQLWAEQYARRRRGEPVGLLTAIRLVLVYPGLRTALLHRLAFAADRAGIPIVPLILTNLNLSLHGFDMPAFVQVGARFFVPHPVGTVVMARRIGSGVTLVSGVTIGKRKGADAPGVGDDVPDFPVLGDDVYVGAGARILGRITVGDGARIGANAVVIRDVPAGHVAVGVPATVRPPGPRC